MIPEITNVIRWKNGMVMIFDQNGDQMPEYQGKWEDLKHKIVEDMPNDVEIIGPKEWFSDFPNTPIVEVQVAKKDSFLNATNDHTRAQLTGESCLCPRCFR